LRWLSIALIIHCVNCVAQNKIHLCIAFLIRVTLSPVFFKEHSCMLLLRILIYRAIFFSHSIASQKMYNLLQSWYSQTKNILWNLIYR
jgi:hypothetical protein